MSQVSDPPDPVEVDEFKFLQLRKVKLALSGESVPEDAINLVAASSRYGLLFIGFSGGFKVLKLENILDIDEDKDQFRVPSENYLYQKVVCQQPVLLSLSSDDMTLAVCMDVDGCPVADMYDIRVFADPDNSPNPFLKVQLSSSAAKLVDFMWNPVVVEMYAFCLTDGTLHVHEVNDVTLNILAALPASSGATSVCWSPKGKQLVVGNTSGSFSQFKPTLQEVKKIPPPQLNGANVQVINICWLATTSFAVLYLAIGDTVPSLVLVSTPKGAAVKYTMFGDICLGFGTSRRPRYMMHHQSEWGILICSSANAVETAVIGCLDPGKSSWVPWILEDGGRAEVPLDKYKETYPLGMNVIFCAQRRIYVSEMEMYPPMPIVFLLSTSGILCPFHILNRKVGIVSAVYPSEPICCEGERKGKDIQPSLSIAQQSANSFQPNPVPIVQTPPPPVLQPINLVQPQQPVSILTSSSMTPRKLPTFQFSMTPIAQAKTEPAPLTPKNSFSPVVSQNVPSMAIYPSISSTPKVQSVNPRAQAEIKVPSIFQSPSSLISESPLQTKTIQENLPVTPVVAAADNNKETELSPGPEAYISAIHDEINNFEAELAGLKELSRNFNFNIGTKSELTEIKKNSLLLKDFHNNMVETMQSLNLDVHDLKTLSLESFGLVGEANSRNTRRNDPKYLMALRERALDPMTVKRMEKIHQLHQYLNSQLQEVHDKIDREWIEHVNNEKNKQKSKLRIPSSQAIYQTVVNNQNTIYNLRNQLDQLCKDTSNLKLKKVNRGSQFSKQLSISTEGDLEKLAESLLQDKASVPKKTKSVTCGKKLPPNIQSAIRNALVNHSITCVRPKAIASPCQSRLLSLSVLPKKSPQIKSSGQTEVTTSTQMNKGTSMINNTAKPVISAAQSVPNVNIISSPSFDVKPFPSFTIPTGQAQSVGRITHGTPIAKPNPLPLLTSLLSDDRRNIAPATIPSKSPSAFTQFSDLSGAHSQSPFVVKTSLSQSPQALMSTTKSTGQSFTTIVSAVDSQPNSLDIKTVPTVVKPAASSSLFNFGTKSDLPSFGIKNLLSNKKYDRNVPGVLPLYEDISPPSSPVSFQEVESVGGDLEVSIVPRDELAFGDKIKENSSNGAEVLVHKLPTSEPRGDMQPIWSPISSDASITKSGAPTIAPVSAIFNKQSTQTSIFGKSKSIFGQATTPTSGPASTTASSSLFFSQTATTAASSTFFGQAASTTTVTSPFGLTSITASTIPIGQKITTSSSSVTCTTSSQQPASPSDSVSAVSSSTSVPAGQATSPTTTTNLFGQTTNVTTSYGQGTNIATTTDPLLQTVTAATSPFGQPASSASATSPFGQNGSTAVTSPFTPATSASVSSPFAQAAAVTSPFGQTPATTATSPFNQTPAATTVSSPFGQATTTVSSPFGQSVPTVTSPFGQATQAVISPFGQPATTVASPFGQAATTTVTSPFGQAATTTVASPFGQAAITTVSSPFNQVTSTTGATSPFGQASSPFGQPNINTTAFGQGGSPASSFFGTASPGTNSAFGQSEQQKSVFGNQPASSFSFNKTAFGTTASNNSSFGLTKAVFGQPTNQTSSAFGQTSPQPAFGQNLFSGLGGKPSEQNASKNVFSFPAESQTANETTLFGNQGASVFGSKVGSFSAGSFSTGGGSVAQSGFGAFQQTPSKPAQFPGQSFQGSFGSPPAFGGGSTFGGAATFGSSPTFGSGPQAAAAASGSVFGTSPTQGFSSFASADAPSFGTLASGGSSGFGNMQQQQQQPQAGMFGGPVFGGGGGGSFGGQQQQQQSVFGSPNAGGQSAFSQWRS